MDTSEPIPPAAPFLSGRNRRVLIAAGAVALLCLLIGIVITTLVGQHRRQEGSKHLLREALVVQTQYPARAADLDRRLSRIGFEPFLRPTALATREGVAGGVAMLKQYRALLAERASLVAGHVADVERSVEAVPPGPFQEGARESAIPGIEVARRMQVTVDPPQRAHADAIEALLDWAGANQGWFTEHDGRFEFQTPRQQTELVRLAQGLDAASKRVLAAAGEAEAIRVHGEPAVQQALAKAHKLLDD